MDLVDRARELLQSLEYINIATVSPEGLPWNTPLYARHDPNLVFYWSSWSEAEHSKNIRANENCFITLYDSTRKRGDNNRRCLFAQARAYELESEEEIEQILLLLYGTEAAQYQTKEFLGEGLKRLYRAHPEKLWLNDVSERELTPHTIKMRVEVPLDALLKSSL